MDRMSLYLQQKTIEDQILDNYILLKEVILGERRLVLSRKKKNRELPVNKCISCGAEFKSKDYYGRTKYCGNRQDRTGCITKYFEILGSQIGKRNQLLKKYNQLKTIWEQEE